MSEFARELTELVRSLAGSGNGDQWPELQDLGLVGIGTAEDAGGSGGSFADLLVLIREMSRAGITGPIVEASTALYAVGPTDGFDTVTFCSVRSDSTTTDLGSVPYADGARSIVLIGTRDIAAVPVTGSGVTVLPCADVGGVPVAAVHLSGVAVQPYEGGPAAGDVGARLALARSAALLGSAAAAYDLTRAYVTERQQFGAPLIAIPAVSASLAQMAVRIRTTQSVVDRAAGVLMDGEIPGERCFAAAAAARIIAAESATHIARAAHQLHGAVGITAEYGLHPHTRRLWAWRDADLTEQTWSERLGENVRGSDESTFWEQLTG